MKSGSLKRILAIVLSIMMIFGISLSAFAENSGNPPEMPSGGMTPPDFGDGQPPEKPDGDMICRPPTRRATRENKTTVSRYGKGNCEADRILIGFDRIFLFQTLPPLPKERIKSCSRDQRLQQ